MRIKALSLKLNLVSGGGSNYDLDMKLKYLKSAGHDVVLITLYSSDNKVPHNVGYEIVEENFSGNFIETQKYICEILRKNERETDLFYLHGHAFLWAGGEYKKRGGTVPVAVFANNYTDGMGLTHRESESADFSQQFKNALHKIKHLLWEKTFGIKKANHINCLIVDSPVVKNIYSSYGIDKNKIIVIPDFIDTDKLKKNNELAVSRPVFFKSGYLNLLYVGRLIYDKGVDLIIEALKNIKDGKILVHIVGNGPQFKTLESMIKKNKLDSKIFMHGWKQKNDIVSFYKYADAFVHPARWPEPLGHTIIEAMYFNKPVITSAKSGSAWVAGKNGLTFKNRDANDLKEKIVWVYNNIASLQAKNVDSRERALEFDYKKTAKKFEILLDNLRTSSPINKI